MYPSEFLQFTLADINESKGNIKLTMNDVQEDFLGLPHGTTAAAVISNKNKTEILLLFIINILFRNDDGPYRGFGFSNLPSDPIDLATSSQRE